MKVNFSSVSTFSYKGNCTIGKNYAQKASIASNLLTSSRDNQEAKEKAEVLNKAAKTIAQQTDENENLYIYLMPCETRRGIFTVLPCRQYIELHSQDDDKDICIARDCINSIEKPDTEFIKILARKLTEPNMGYCEVSEELKLCKKIPPEITSQEELRPIIDILV